MARRGRLEFLAVAATGALHIVFIEILHLKALFIALVIVGWSLYVLRRVRENRGLLREWGWGRRGLLPAFFLAALFSAVASGAMALVARGAGTLRWSPHMLPLLVAYPVWGLVQQFLVQALAVRNLSEARGWAGSPVVVSLVAAVLFGLVHAPDVRLSLATFFLGLVFTPIYLRWRNLWPLGLFHGWLGVFVYFWILGRDPWLEVFG